MNKNIVLGLVVIFSAMSVSSTAWSDVSFFTGLEVRYDDNIGFAPFSGDEIDDITTELDLGLNWNIYSAATAQVSLLSSVYYAYVADLSDLSEYGIDVDLGYRGQVSPDFTALWWSVSGQAKWMEFNDSDIRDGWSAEARVEVGKRFTNVFGLSAGGTLETRRSTDSNPDGQTGSPTAAVPAVNPEDVFDLDNWSVFLQGTFMVGTDTEIFTRYTFRSGDVAATGLAPPAGPRGWNNFGAYDRAWDYAFGQDLNSFYFAWQIDADQHIFDVGVSHILTEQIVLEGALGYLDASGEDDNDYDNLFATVSAIFSF